jgi:antibiotic biosynthesis monooxygenase (ABM) superfamily enzyme
MENPGATAVITHHILKGKHQEYEDWLNEIGPICRRSNGHMDWQIIRPIPNLTVDYTVILRFDTIENLKHWMESKERKDLIKKVTPLLSKDDKYHIQNGLDFLFMKENEKTNIPVRWKQYLVTWSAIYPLSVIIPLMILPLLRQFNLPQNRYIDAVFVSGIIVFIMLYLLMPSYTKLIKKWLYS